MKVLASFIGATVPDGGEKLVALAQEISIDGRPVPSRKTERLDEVRQEQQRVAAGNIPDAPEMVQVGQGVGLTDVDEDGASSGLSAPGSFEKAMLMFGPPLEPSPDVAKKIELPGGSGGRLHPGRG